MSNDNVNEDGNGIEDNLELSTALVFSDGTEQVCSWFDKLKLDADTLERVLKLFEGFDGEMMLKASKEDIKEIIVDGKLLPSIGTKINILLSIDKASQTESPSTKDADIRAPKRARRVEDIANNEHFGYLEQVIHPEGEFDLNDLSALGEQGKHVYRNFHVNIRAMLTFERSGNFWSVA